MPRGGGERGTSDLPCFIYSALQGFAVGGSGVSKPHSEMLSVVPR